MRAIANMLLRSDSKKEMAGNFGKTSCTNGNCRLKRTGKFKAGKALDNEPGTAIVADNVYIRAVQVT